MTKAIAFVVVGILGAFALGALGASVHLVALIIRLENKDATLLAIYVSLVTQLISASTATTAILGVLLNNIYRQPSAEDKTDATKEPPSSS